MAVAVGIVSLVVSAAIGMTRDIPGITGDEPHYLLIAQSIVRDGDIDLTNDYASPERVANAYPGFTELDPVTHAGVYHEGGPVSPIHAIGLPLLLTPAYLLGGGYELARVVALLISAVAASAMFFVVERLVRRPWVAVVSVLGVMLVVPSVAFAHQIYPEVPAAALLATSLAVLVTGRLHTWRLVLAAALAALMPWMHLRFAVLVLPLALAILLRALELPAPGGVQAVRDALVRHWRRALAAMAPLVVSAAGILAYHQVLFGSMAPNAAYRPDVFPSELPFQPTFVWIYGVGSILDEQRGILPYAPVLLVALAGVVAAVLRWRWWAVLGVVTCAGYLAIVSGVAQGGGYCPPGRWLATFAPLFAIPLAAALTHARRTWWFAAPLLVLSLAVSAQLLDRYEDLYPVAGQESQVLPVAERFGEVWPDVMERRGPGYIIDGARLAVGGAGESRADGAVASVPGAVGAVAEDGPRRVIASTYQAVFRVTLTGEPGETVGLAQLLAGDDVLQEYPLTVPESGATREVLEVGGTVAVGGQDVVSRVLTFGNGGVVVHRSALMWQEDGEPGLLEQLNDLPGGFLWGVVLVLLAVVVVAGTPVRRGHRTERDAPGDDAASGPVPEPTEGTGRRDAGPARSGTTGSTDALVNTGADA
ncbi:hypothetical protein Cfla_2378 [Cellulomonas flavigena DSM 20109]|uniref:Glycosyltransferase RgtA/B/C/D-like domain-containing protein n=2 Tax=Cellulomonas flavigena TaxID=1711 RepID=D5UHE7_CELFN|nr:hypothetical protein Cfla_2378 [Cellulomonas flavigena DSM 20109]